MTKINDDLGYTPWLSSKILHFDLECTDLLGDDPFPYGIEGKELEDWLKKYEGKKIVEFAGAIVENGKRKESLHLLLDPEMPIPAESSAVHFITDDMVAGKPKFFEVKDLIVEFFKRGDILCAYNGMNFDKRYLELEFARVSGKLLEIGKPLFDPFLWYKNKLLKDNKLAGAAGKRRKSASLLACATAYGCAKSAIIHEGIDAAHRAMADIEMQMDVVMAMSVRDIQEYTVFDLISGQKIIEVKIRNQGK